MKKCADCGCILNNGRCSNCHEELCILEDQSEYITEPVSDGFARKAEDQRKQIEREVI